MSSLQEIEDAIAKLPESEVEELLEWIAQRRPKKELSHAEEWLHRARGAASEGVTTEGILKITRSEP